MDFGHHMDYWSKFRVLFPLSRKSAALIYRIKCFLSWEHLEFYILIMDVNLINEIVQYIV